MRINEDYLDNIDSDEMISHDSAESFIWSMQDRRPIEDVLSDYRVIFNVGIKFPSTASVDYIRKTIIEYAKRLKDVLENRLLNVDVSPVIIGSSEEQDEFDYNKFDNFTEYIIKQSADDRGFTVKFPMQMFIGIKSKKKYNTVNAFKLLTQVNNIVRKTSNDLKLLRNIRTIYKCMNRVTNKEEWKSFILVRFDVTAGGIIASFKQYEEEVKTGRFLSMLHDFYNERFEWDTGDVRCEMWDLEEFLEKR